MINKPQGWWRWMRWYDEQYQIHKLFGVVANDRCLLHTRTGTNDGAKHEPRKESKRKTLKRANLLW